MIRRIIEVIKEAFKPVKFDDAAGYSLSAAIDVSPSTSAPIGATLARQIEEAQARFDAMTPEEQEEHRHEQRRSYMRSLRPLDKTEAEWNALVDRLTPPRRK